MKTLFSTIIILLVSTFASSISAQLLVENGYNSLPLTIKSCRAEGKNVVVTFYLRNNSSQDLTPRNFFIKTLIDDEGNSYDRDRNCTIKQGGKRASWVDIPNNTRVKMTLEVGPVDPAASAFDVIQLQMYIKEKGNVIYEIRNLPISRD